MDSAYAATCNNIAVFDTETTGLLPKNVILNKETVHLFPFIAQLGCGIVKRVAVTNSNPTRTSRCKSSNYSNSSKSNSSNSSKSNSSNSSNSDSEWISRPDSTDSTDSNSDSDSFEGSECASDSRAGARNLNHANLNRRSSATYATSTSTATHDQPKFTYTMVRDRINTLVCLASHAIMSPGAENTHGLSHAHCRAHGVTVHELLDMMANIIRRHDIDLMACHNVAYDATVLRAECMRARMGVYGMPTRRTCANVAIILDKMNHSFCTMKSTTVMCRLPHKVRGGHAGLPPGWRERVIAHNAALNNFKWPRLEELHRHCFGTTPANLHDAFTDVLVTIRCFAAVMAGVDMYETDPHFRERFRPIISESEPIRPRDIWHNCGVAGVAKTKQKSETRQKETETDKSAKKSFLCSNSITVIILKSMASLFKCPSGKVCLTHAWLALIAIMAGLLLWYILMRKPTSASPPAQSPQIDINVNSAARAPWGPAIQTPWRRGTGLGWGAEVVPVADPYGSMYGGAYPSASLPPALAPIRVNAEPPLPLVTVGILRPKDGTNVSTQLLSLMGRPITRGGNKWQYFAKADTGMSLQMVVGKKNASNEYGIPELENGAQVDIVGLEGVYVAELNSSSSISVF